MNTNLRYQWINEAYSDIILQSGLGCLGVPVIYGADIGHIPPQIQIINGAYGVVDFEDGGAMIEQEMRT